MVDRFSVSVGALCDPIEDQLQRQGLTLGDAAKQIQGWANAITDLAIFELLTETERNRARRRLMKRISSRIQRLPDSDDD